MISAFYAGLLGLLFIFLSMRVINRRREAKISVGDKGDAPLFKCQRVQANFVEYTPFSLILLFLLEAQQLTPALLHLAGLTILAGRLMHAYGFGSSPQKVPFRIWGMYLTFGSIMAMAIANIGMSIL